MKKLLLLSVMLLSLTSCSKDEVDNTPPKVLVIGNSITQCAPGGEWLGNWGMAASSPDKDFCSLLKTELQTDVLNRKNIAVWENNFNVGVEHYGITTSLQYDYVVIKVGENVSDVCNFKDALKKLVNYYKKYGNNIILVTTVWSQYQFDSSGNPYEVISIKDKIIREVSIENKCILVDLLEMKSDPTNYAWGEYQNSGIASHPNDKGMKFISDKILFEIRN
jgi:hypothetical protein